MMGWLKRRRMRKAIKRYWREWVAAGFVIDRLEPGLAARTLTDAECHELADAITKASKAEMALTTLGAHLNG